MQETLEALGLSGYEARALVHLLRNGPRAGPDLARETGIPFGRIYDTLQALQDRRLVTAGSGRPRLFTVIAASAIPGRLLAARRRGLQESETEATQQTARLEAELRTLPNRATPAAHLYGVRIGEDAARDFLVEATHAATSAICAFLSVQRITPQDLALFEAFRQAVDRGIPTRLLLRRSDVDYLLSTPYVQQVLDALGPHLGATLQVRFTDAETQPFSILDDERVVLGIHNPLDAQSYFAVVHMEDRVFAADLLGKFDTLWRKGRWDAGLVKAVATRPTLRKLAARARRSTA